MDADLLAFVTGLDPKEAEDVVNEIEPGTTKKTKVTKKNGKVSKKVTIVEPTLNSKFFTL